jgi:hypothetical protein
MGREKQLHDAQPWFCAHRGEHIGISHDLFRIGLLCHRSLFHISISIEISKDCQAAGREMWMAEEYFPPENLCGREPDQRR